MNIGSVIPKAYDRNSLTNSTSTPTTMEIAVDARHCFTHSPQPSAVNE